MVYDLEMQAKETLSSQSCLLSGVFVTETDMKTQQEVMECFSGKAW